MTTITTLERLAGGIHTNLKLPWITEWVPGHPKMKSETLPQSNQGEKTETKKQTYGLSSARSWQALADHAQSPGFNHFHSKTKWNKLKKKNFGFCVKENEWNCIKEKEFQSRMSRFSEQFFSMSSMRNLDKASRIMVRSGSRFRCGPEPCEPYLVLSQTRRKKATLNRKPVLKTQWGWECSWKSPVVLEATDLFSAIDRDSALETDSMGSEWNWGHDHS